MAAIAGTARWTRRFRAAVRNWFSFPTRVKVKPLTFADQRKMQRDAFGVDQTPCRCPGCRNDRFDDAPQGRLRASLDLSEARGTQSGNQQG